MTSLLTLLDDIATTLDDVSVMTKLALKKTSAIMSDDLAVNSAVVHGVNPDRELPIVKAIFLGSLLNKIYSIVGVILLAAFAPMVLKVVLLFGGLYLAFEGGEKVYEKFFHRRPETEMVSQEVVTEKSRIAGAIRTDLILSIEIIVIANDSVSGTIFERLMVLGLVGLGASLLIYGLVAFLVKVDDFGLYLISKGQSALGQSLVDFMPKMMRGLGIVGTLAMFLVGGGIISHTFHFPMIMPEFLQNLILGLVVGLLIVFTFEAFKKLLSR